MDELKALVDQLGVQLGAQSEAAAELQAANDALVAAQATVGDKQATAITAHQGVVDTVAKIKALVDQLAG